MLKTIRQWSAMALTLAALAAQAQAPDGPLRIVVGYPPGGSSDRVARIVGEKLQARLGVPVLVENKTGAGGRLAAQQVKATPAGQHVLTLANPAVMVVAPLAFKVRGENPALRGRILAEKALGGGDCCINIRGIRLAPVGAK